MRQSHQGAPRRPPRRRAAIAAPPSIDVQALESRLLLSHVAAPGSAPRSAPGVGAAVPPRPDPAAASLTVTDRRQLLAPLTPGPLTASLSKSLRYSGPAAFDA